MNKNFDSKEEGYFDWYCKELKKNGFIKDYGFKEKGYSLINKVDLKIKKELKTKTKIVNKSLLSKTTYLPDFHICWTKKAIKKLTGYIIDNKYWKYPKSYFTANAIKNNSGKIIDVLSIIEIKGSAFKNRKVPPKASDVRFPMKQKLMFLYHNLYVQSIIVPYQKKPLKGLFYETFTPTRFLLTDKTMTARKINFKPKKITDI